MLIDGYSLAFRCYLAFAKSIDGGLHTKAVILISVCFGFFKCLLKLLIEQWQSFAVAFDLALPTFPHEAEHTYKAGRAKTSAETKNDVETFHETSLQCGLHQGYQKLRYSKM